MGRSVNGTRYSSAGWAALYTSDATVAVTNPDWQERKQTRQINTSTCRQCTCIATGYLPTLLVQTTWCSTEVFSQTSTFRARFSVAISHLIYHDDPISYNTTTLSFNCALIKVSICLLVREITGHWWKTKSNQRFGLDPSTVSDAILFGGQIRQKLQ